MEVLSVPEMIWMVRTLASRKQRTGNVTDQEICSWLDMKQTEIYNFLYTLQKKHFIVREKTLSYTSGTADYTLPSGYVSMQAIWRDDLSGKPNLIENKILPSQIPYYAGCSWSASAGNEHWIVMNENQIKIVPTPGSDATNALKMVCGCTPFRLLGGTMKDTSTSTSLVVDRPWMKMSYEDDFYNDLYVGIVHKDYMYDPLKIVRVTDYTGSSRTMTIEDCSVDLDDNYLWGIVPELPKYTHYAIVVAAAIIARTQNKEESKDLRDQYNQFLQSVSLMVESGEPAVVDDQWFDWAEGSEIYPNEVSE